jgi:hypothetical protein
MDKELKEAQRRLNLGEPLSTTAAELGLTPKELTDLFAQWSDDMIREYFDTHLNATLHEISALSGRTKADIKRVLMS